MMAEIRPESGPKTGIAKMSPSVTFALPLPAMFRGFAADAGPFVSTAQAAVPGFVFEIEIGQPRKIDPFQSEVGADNC